MIGEPASSLDLVVLETDEFDLPSAGRALGNRPGKSEVAEKSDVTAMERTAAVDAELESADDPLSDAAETLPFESRREGLRTLPPVVFDRQQHYSRAAARLLASGGPGKAAGRVALFVTPDAESSGGFALIELAQAAAAVNHAHTLILSLGDRSEFLPADLRVDERRGAMQVWAGSHAWSEVIERTSDPRIDLVAWGSAADEPAEGEPFPWLALRERYELILIAGGSDLNGPVAKLAPTVDAVVLALHLGRTRPRDAAAMCAALAALRAPVAGCMVVEPVW